MRKLCRRLCAAIVSRVAARCLGCAFLLCLCACGEDDNDTYIPPYVTEFAIAMTDAKGLIKQVRTDSGKEHTFASPDVATDVPDTVFRCVATFTSSADEGCTFYSIKPVFAPLPMPADSFSMGRDNLPHDPVKLLSVWQSRQFLNMTLGVLTTNQSPHAYAFSLDSVVGTTEHISLLHQRARDDGESYTEKLYLSMPTYSHGPGADGVVFHVNTYDGWKEFDFRY